MLERLRVRNFRGPSDVAIEEPGRINLVAGRNNAGKTTLIEALFLLAGAGHPHRAINRNLTRIVLAAATVPGGLVLVDEIENGLHHSVLPDVWRVVGKTAEAFDVQVFATTHSFECVEAARAGLGNGFRLHRLEVVDGSSHCVTYSEDALDGAIRHHMEVR